MTITVQRGTPTAEKRRRRELRKQITGLSMKFMPTDDDIEVIGVLQKEYYALLVFAESECATLTAAEKTHLNAFDKIFGRAVTDGPKTP